ncbi:MAG: hypothetical protein ABFD98_02670 [Syntrophobacteraceae bacterium]
MKAEESSRFRTPLGDADWLMAAETLRSQVSLLDREAVGALVARILRGIEFLDGTMTRYCEITCPDCADACCNGREVFFNQADLLYLVASGFEMPEGQTRNHPFGACRYLGRFGCLLPRTRRPYVCVWFLCESQIRLLEMEPAKFQREFVRKLEDIRSARLMLEFMYECAFPDPVLPKGHTRRNFRP